MSFEISIIIYIIGCIACFFMAIYSFDKIGKEFNVNIKRRDLAEAFFLGLTSFIGLLALVIIEILDSDFWDREI